MRAAFERQPRDQRHNVEVFLHLVRGLSEGGEELRRHVGSLIAIYREAGVLAYFGDGLVRNLGEAKSDRIGRELLEVWRDAWLELGAGLDELEIPLRIFRVGIEYLIRGDERALLALVQVERSVLRQALGLDAANLGE